MQTQPEAFAYEPFWSQAFAISCYSFQAPGMSSPKARPEPTFWDIPNHSFPDISNMSLGSVEPNKNRGRRTPKRQSFVNVNRFVGVPQW